MKKLAMAALAAVFLTACTGPMTLGKSSCMGVCIGISNTPTSGADTQD